MRDMALAIGFPMWLVAFVTVLVSQSLFPDETDFLVLTAAALVRPVVFRRQPRRSRSSAGLFTIATQPRHDGRSSR